MTLRYALVAAGAALCLAGGAAPAAAEKMNVLLDDDKLGLSYTPCPADEADECIAYSLDCHPDDSFGSGIHVTIMGNEQSGPNARALAAKLLQSNFGEAKIVVKLAGGKTLELMVSALTVSENEMNGDWDLALHSYDNTTLYDALTEASAKSATMEIAGQSFMLADNKDATTKLLSFKKACDSQ